MKAEQSIGIFDSGVGGLTVANAVKSVLPNESIVYFGDTAHLPYGDKSAENIRFYSEQIAEFLLEQNCKIILIACNTASALAYKTVKERVGERAHVFNVIDPVVRLIKDANHLRKIAIIGTKGTIQSNTYPQKIREEIPEANVVSLATPLLVPMIEEGFIYDDISNAIIRSYLSQIDLSEPDALILACTHYPLIKNQIRKFYNFDVEVVDSGNAVANEIKAFLQENHLLNPNTQPRHRFLVSDYTPMFKKIAEMFFEHRIELETRDIWKK